MEEEITTNAGEAVMTDQPVVSEEAVPQKKKRKPINQQKLQDNIWGWVFCLPLIIGTVWFIYITFIMAFLLSFTSYRVGNSTPMLEVIFNLGKYINTSEYGGAFAWYKDIFTETTYVQDASLKMNEMGAYLFNTVFYMIGIPIGMVLAVFFAVCMSRDIKGGNVFRVVYYFPCVASAISVIFTFQVLFKQQGVINQLFNAFDENGSGFVWLPSAPSVGNSWYTLMKMEGEVTNPFLIDPYWCQGLITKCVIIIMSVWKGLGGTIILYLAGLSGVNAATKEAAQIDGANGWQIFWKVTMPDLYPVIFYNIVTSVIGGLQIYAEPELFSGGEYILTSGFVSLIYRYGITDRYAGRGAAYGIFLAVIIFILTLFQFWLDKRNAE